MALEDMGRTGQAMSFRNEANNNPMGALEIARGSEGLQPISSGAMDRNVSVQEQPVDTWDGGVGSLHEMLFTPSRYLGNDSLDSLAIKPFVEKEIDKAKEERLNVPSPLQDIGRKALGFNPEDEVRLANTGGLMGMAAGGRFDGRVPGQGHGMQDNVYMPIKEEGQQIATLAVSPKEYVVDAHTMSAIGNGNADAGADVMDKVVDKIREKAFGTDQQPNEINGLAALRPMIERV